MITLDQDRFMEVIRKLLAKTYYRYVRIASEKEATLFSVDENRGFFPENLEQQIEDYTKGADIEIIQNTQHLYGLYHVLQTLQYNNIPYSAVVSDTRTVVVFTIGIYTHCIVASYTDANKVEFSIEISTSFIGESGIPIYKKSNIKELNSVLDYIARMNLDPFAFIATIPEWFDDDERK